MGPKHSAVWCFVKTGTVISISVIDCNLRCSCLTWQFELYLGEGLRLQSRVYVNAGLVWVRVYIRVKVPVLTGNHALR